MPTPNWSAAATGVAASASQVNQFLGTHGLTFIYQGASIGGVASNAGAVNINSSTLFIDQPFTMSGTVITRADLALISITGAGADVTLGLYTDNAGNPNTLLTSEIVPLEWFNATNAMISIPINITGLTNAATLHWVLNSPAATGGNFSTVGNSAVTGLAARTATTFPGGPWTTQAYSLQLQWFNGTGGRIRGTYEDAAARITSLSYDANGNVSRTLEATGQSAAGVGVRSNRVITNSGGILTSIA